MVFIFLILRIAICTGLIFGSIKAVEYYNTKNNWTTTLVISVIFSLFANWVGGILIVFPLFVYLLILTKYYDLGLIQGILSVVALCLAEFLLSFLIQTLFLSSASSV